MTLSEELTWRGFVNQTTYKDISILDKKPVRFYWGVDPSAPSMTVGNLAAAMMVKCFIKHGHKAVLLVGGATGLVGDPDGKADERNLLSIKEVNRNKKVLESQYRQLFGKKSFKLVDNYSWFKDINYLEFLREVGKHVPMRQMLAREFVDARLGEGGSGISYAEFSYVLIQAYDFLKLNETEHVTLQVCGSDQWGNSIAGVDLIRRKIGGEANVFSSPLIVNKTSGVKFGKTEAGAIWLDPALTSPTQFYQFWINTEDDDVGSYLKIFTELSKKEVENIFEEHKIDASKRHAQQVLALETTRLVHGDQSAKLAQSVTEFLTGKKLIGEADKTSINAIRHEIPTVKAKSGSDIIKALVASNLASSNTEARRLLQANSISINGQKVSREQFEKSDFQNGRLILKRGKAFKDSALVEQR